jgi:threonine dehydrogenase-like Zn-dependent dehydrogenase
LSSTSFSIIVTSRGHWVREPCSTGSVSPTVDPATQPAEDITATLGGPPTVVVDAVGTSRTVRSALDIAAPGARIVLVGMAAPASTSPPGSRRLAGCTA